MSGPALENHHRTPALKKLRSLFAVALVCVPFAASAQLPSLKSIPGLGGLTSPSGGGDAGGQNDSLVRGYVAANKDVLLANSQMADALGLKDAAGFLSPFRGLARNVTAVPIPGAHEAPHAPETLAEAARSVGLSASVARDVESALRHIDTNHPGPKRILICGSLYLAGDALALNGGVD